MAKKNPLASQVLKQVAALNNSDTMPNPGANPLTPMSRTVRAVPLPRTPQTVLDPMARNSPFGSS